MRFPSLATALLTAALGGPVLAQSTADHQGHHPDQKTAPDSPSPAQPGTRSSMMPEGMMGGRMMNMMGGNMPMMGIMTQPAGGMGGMDPIDHIEGRIAFLRAELKITDAQSATWTTFADALRANARALGELRTAMRSSMMGGSSAVLDRLAAQEKMLTTRLDGIRSMKSALATLMATFTDEQKKSADELLPPQLGMMPMIGGMQGPMMGMGQMPPDKPRR